MPDSPSARGSIERPWLVLLVLAPIMVAAVFCIYATIQAGGRITWRIDDAAGLHCFGAMSLMGIKRQAQWRWWHRLAAGGVLGAVIGVARWTIHIVFTPDAPIPFVEAVAASAVLTACWTLFLTIGNAQYERVLARLGGRA
jgi:hypothetical protein